MHEYVENKMNSIMGLTVYAGYTVMHARANIIFIIVTNMPHVIIFN